ncbi:ubiquitin carboxyl-terminal hydrolase 12 [Phtheirospermum japonicum]|uniref:Ubiquitin carboxyl-terminal hydrolase 12 n=1 Tax=Phtheirospermum japonicum TaxID=374723 RepID=A0A830D6B2_9LAMI|nr:ubiquitin carboxyl-terminal hydrolase 12 [Phtheirospermum japonicum]
MISNGGKTGCQTVDNRGAGRWRVAVWNSGESRCPTIENDSVGQWITAIANEVAAMETREASPAHLLVKIESFSLLHKCGIDKYETRDFDAGNYKWRLVIHPKGHGTEKDGEYISAYLAISDTNSLPENWEVNAVFSIFILNQISGNYHYTPGKTTRRYFSMMMEWGFPKFISKKLFTTPSNGYLMDDNCVFGAEVFVNKNKVVTEYLSLKNVTVPYKKVLEISNFSTLKDIWYSEEFTAGSHKWKITLYPNGNRDEIGCNLSIYLNYVASDDKKTPGERMKASFTICIKNQLDSAKHQKKTTSTWFSASKVNWGWHSFLSLADLNDPNGGFIVSDSCHLEVEISVQAVAQ